MMMGCAGPCGGAAIVTVTGIGWGRSFILRARPAISPERDSTILFCASTDSFKVLAIADSSWEITCWITWAGREDAATAPEAPAGCAPATGSAVPGAELCAGVWNGDAGAWNGGAAILIIGEKAGGVGAPPEPPPPGTGGN